MDNQRMPAILMSLLSFLCLALIFRGLRRSDPDGTGRRSPLLLAILLCVAWVLALSLLALKGFFSDFTHLPPRPGLVILFPLPFILFIAFSKKGTQLLKRIPPHWLIYIQSFRILVELLLWLCYTRKLLPVQMTFEGRNADILTGILAIPVGYFCWAKKSWSGKLALAFNILGLLLLLNIVVVAALSMPTPLRYFMNEPANTLVGEFPFIFLPGILVPIAYSMHIFSLRQLSILSVGGKARI
jgi:hypothetical protein